MIPYSRQNIDSKDMKEVLKVLKSDFLTTGPMVEKFEQEAAKFVGTKYAVALINGTAALHSACYALGINAGDEVITAPYSFAATANSVLYCGGKVVFVDIDSQTFNIDSQLIEKKITKRTKVIIVVDFGGLPADWARLRQIARKHNLKLIADSAHSFGASYKNKNVGTLADITCFSFHPVKTITTGEGGMVVTNSKQLANKIRHFRSHGIYKQKNNKLKPWFYEMRDLGFNYRLTDIQSALGLAQLRNVKSFINKRRLLWKRYNRLLRGLDNVLLPQEPADRKSACHLYPLRINFLKLKKSRTNLFRLMKQKGIKLQVHYIPTHYHPYYRKQFGYTKGEFPISEEIYEQEVSLPLYPKLSFSQQDQVIKLLRQFVNSNQ